MNNILKLILVSGLTAVTLAQTQARAASRTNVVLDAKITMTAHVQNMTVLQTNTLLRSAELARISTKDIINAMGTDIGHGTNIFPANAKLLFAITDVGQTNETDAFMVRAGTNDTDVTHYLSLSNPDFVSVETSRTN